jgi:hypothetical protein
MTRASFRSILEEILSVPPGTLTDGDTRESVRAWTSLADVQIVTIIASELQMDDDPELIDYNSVGDLLDELERRGALVGV